MSNGLWRVKPSEIARSVKSVQSVGLQVRNVEIAPDGTIRINVGNGDAVPIAPDAKAGVKCRV